MRGLAVANGCTEFHYCLIVVSRTICIEEFAGEGTKFFLGGSPILERFVAGKKSCENADHVPVADRFRASEGNAGYGRRYIGTDSGKRLPSFRILGDDFP